MFDEATTQQIEQARNALTTWGDNAENPIVIGLQEELDRREQLWRRGEIEEAREAKPQTFGPMPPVVLCARCKAPLALSPAGGTTLRGAVALAAEPCGCLEVTGKSQVDVVDALMDSATSKCVWFGLRRTDDGQCVAAKLRSLCDNDIVETVVKPTFFSAIAEITKDPFWTETENG